MSANLSLYYHDNESISIPSDVGVYRVNGNWVETGITWNTQPSAVTLPSTTATIPVPSTNSFILWDNLKTLSQGWVNHSIVNYGLMLKDTNEATSEGYKLFYSTDATDYYPKLEISYYDPAP
jgi:hypothetical protein